MITTKRNGTVDREDFEEAAQVLDMEIVDEPIQPGDFYLAGRNTGPHLLTCKSVNPKNWIVPVEEGAYCYDTWNTVKVVPKPKKEM